MNYKQFRSKDLIYNTIATQPQYSFSVYKSRVYLQKEKEKDISFTSTFPEGIERNRNKNIKHLPLATPGAISLHEININRPSGSLVYPFVDKTGDRMAFKSVSVSNFDALGHDLTEQGEIGTFQDKYPLTASLSRIFVKSGTELEQDTNRKYIRALRNPLSTQLPLGSTNLYDGVKTSAVNMICIPGIFYGSSLTRGSVELNYYIAGTLAASASDKYEDGRIIQTYAKSNSSTEEQIGTVLYNQGLILLTSSTVIDLSLIHI